MDATNLVSVGAAVADYQVSPQALRVALDRAQVSPQLVLNGLGYYRPEDIARTIQSMALRAVVTQPVAPELPRVF